MRGELCIHVVDSHISRATRIIDAIIKLLESKGQEFFINQLGTNIEINEHSYQFSLRTENKRVIDEESRYSFQTTKLIPQDILIFKIFNIISAECEDRPNKPLEKKLKVIIARIELMSIEDTKMVEEARRRKQDYEENILQIETIRIAREQEEAKFDRLVLDAENWSKSIIISKYLDEMEQMPNLTQEELEYITWGRKRVSILNPLTIQSASDGAL